MLSDFHPKGEVCRRFDVYRDDIGTSERALFVLDGDGRVFWSHVSPIEVNPGADGVLDALERLTGKELELAAEAAEAAGAQGKFWEMHDTLFTNQDALEYPSLVGHAGELALDTSRFAHDLQEHRYLPSVRRDFMQGVRSGVNGTPTLFIDGERWNGPYTAAALLAGIRGHRPPQVEPMTGLPWGPGLSGI